MIAFVLSGGGNRGALQVGAIQVLQERGIVPDLLVGTSAGAMNAVFLAGDASTSRGQRLARVWESVTSTDIYPGSHAAVLWRLIRGSASLYTNANLHRFVQRWLRVAALCSFGDIQGIRPYVVASHLDTGAERVFGDNPHDRLLDAIMASTALPPLHPPWYCSGLPYVDGAFAANLPIRIAAERGADEIYALHTTHPAPRTRPLRGMADIAAHALEGFLNQQLETQLHQITERRDVRLHYVPLTAWSEVSFLDFGHAREMIAAGRAAMEAYCDRPASMQTTAGGVLLAQPARLATRVASRTGHAHVVTSNRTCASQSSLAPP